MLNSGIPLQSAQNPEPNEDMLAMLGLHPMQLEVAKGLHSGDIHPQQVLDAVTPKTPAPAPATPATAPAAPSIAPPPTAPLIASPRSAPPLPTIAQPTRTELDQSELERLNRTGSGLQQFQQRHPVLGTIARIGAGVGSAFFPTIAAAIPGTDIHHQMLVHQAQGRVAEDQGEQEKQQQISDQEATRQETEARTNAIQHPPEKQGLTPEETTIHDLMMGNNGQPRVNPDTGKPYSYLEAYAAVNQAKQDVKPDKTPNFEEQTFNEWKQTHPNGTRMEFDKERKTNERAPEKEPRQLAVGPDGTVIELKPGVKVPAGTKTTAKYGEPTADEARRSDLARNLNENFDQLEDIINRRPELFGPLAGRWTELKGKFGSDDPDIAALQTIEHQIGMAQISAHGMKSAHGIEGAANSIMNGFHSGPKAIKGAIEAARKSVGTFQNDAGEATGSAPKGTSAAASAPTSSGKSVSLAAAKQLPQNRGKSDDEIRDDIKAHGHKVVD